MRKFLAFAFLLSFVGTATGAAQPAADTQQKLAQQELFAATSTIGPGLAECPDPEYYKLNPFLYFAIPILCQTPIQTARAEAMLYFEEEMNKVLPLAEIPEFLFLTLKGFAAGVVYLAGLASEQLVPAQNPLPLPLPAANAAPVQALQ